MSGLPVSTGSLKGMKEKKKSSSRAYHPSRSSSSSQTQTLLHFKVKRIKIDSRGNVISSRKTTGHTVQQTNDPPVPGRILSSGATDMSPEAIPTESPAASDPATLGSNIRASDVTSESDDSTRPILSLNLCQYTPPSQDVDVTSRFSSPTMEDIPSYGVDDSDREFPADDEYESSQAIDCDSDSAQSRTLQPSSDLKEQVQSRPLTTPKSELASLAPLAPLSSSDSDLAQPTLHSYHDDPSFSSAINQPEVDSTSEVHDRRSKCDSDLSWPLQVADSNLADVEYATTMSVESMFITLHTRAARTQCVAMLATALSSDEWESTLGLIQAWHLRPQLSESSLCYGDSNGGELPIDMHISDQGLIEFREPVNIPLKGA